MSTGTRLYAKFRTASRFYIYDTSSNQILQVSREVWDAVDDYLVVRREGADDADLDPVSRQIEDGLSHGFLAECIVHAMRFREADGELDLALVKADIASRISHVTLELTEACNARCHYCPYAIDVHRSGAPRRMSWETLTKAVALFMAHSADAPERSVSFWGGEPLLELSLMRRAVDHITREYPRHRITYHLTTNGTLFSETAAQFLIAHNVLVVVSLDGPAVVHDRYRVLRSGEGTFERIVAGLRRIQTQSPEYYGSRVRFHCVLTPGNDIRAVERFFEEQDLFRGHNVVFQPVGPTRPFESCPVSLSDADERDIRFSLRDAAATDEPGAAARPLAKAGITALQPIAVRDRSPLGAVIHPNGCCAPLLEKMLVSVEGRIHLCERLDYDNCVGDVHGTGIDADVVAGIVREYSERSIEDCRSCWAMRLCKACYRDFIARNTWAGERRAATCAASRARTLEALEDYAAILERHPAAFDPLTRPS